MDDPSWQQVVFRALFLVVAILVCGIQLWFAYRVVLQQKMAKRTPPPLPSPEEIKRILKQIETRRKRKEALKTWLRNAFLGARVWTLFYSFVYYVSLNRYVSVWYIVGWWALFFWTTGDFWKWYEEAKKKFKDDLINELRKETPYANCEKPGRKQNEKQS